ncbi:MAG: HPr family phosphocarrier protein [Glaciecola sp.]|jgi:phosphotransferase system HPr (HPr) family protein
MTKVCKTLVIKNKLGLHARPATKLAQLSAQYDAELHLQIGSKSANACSVLGLMMLEGQQGKSIDVTATGPDAEEALDAVEALICHNFYEED